MLRKTLTALLAILLLAVVATASAATAAASSPGQSRMTICHNPPGGSPRTMDIPGSAWKGHKNHGDHQGACTSADQARPASGAGSGPDADRPVPTTPLSLSAKGEGRVDGDAWFRVVVRNPGHDVPLDVALDGTLTGDGRWTVEGAPDGACSFSSKQHLTCSFGDLPAGQDVGLRLRLDGQATVCREATATLTLSADNDATSGDDYAREAVHTGACAPLDRDPALAGPV